MAYLPSFKNEPLKFGIPDAPITDTIKSLAVKTSTQAVPDVKTEKLSSVTPVGLLTRLKAAGSKRQEEFNQEVSRLTGLTPQQVGVVSGVTAGATSPLKNVGAIADNVITPIQKLISSLDEAVTSRKVLDKAITAERSVRASRVAETFEQSGGQSGYFKALKQLKGEIAPDKKAFTSLNLEPKDVDSLFNQIQARSGLDVYEKISTSNGLQKLLDGTIPPPSQLSLLEDVFGKELIQKVLEKRPFLEKAKDFVTEVLNVPRSLVTSFDMSAPLRQGILFTTTKPKAALGGVKEMFRQAFSQKNFESWLNKLPDDPAYQLMKDSNLYISNPTKISGGLSAKEEKFMTNLAEKIPVIGSIVKASERSYVGFLNKLRVDVFKQLSSKFIKDGMSPKENPEVFKSLANFVNNGTGRGDLGNLNRISQELNTLFFSPRLIASRFNLLNPIWYAKQPAPVRKEAIKSFAEFVGVGTTVLALAAAAGADVEWDPRSSDFLKIKVGNTRWDIWGGFQQWARVFSQLASGQRKTAKGDVVELSKDVYPFETRKDVAERFLVGKLAPIPGLGYELLQGQKLFGEDITLNEELFQNTVPLYLQDINQAMNEIGPEALFTVGVPGFFGVGTQTYSDKGKTTGRLGSFR